MTAQQEFEQAYLQAVDFTETGEPGQPDRGSALTPLFKAQSLNACASFWRVYGERISNSSASAAQAGHDLWLTRNGHGTGFWDREELYGQELAAELTRVSEVLGVSDAEFELPPPHLGALVRCVKDEYDSDENDQQRCTAADSIGWFAQRDAKNEQWSIHFPNGAAIWVTDDELEDLNQYVVMAPPSLTHLQEVSSTQEWGHAELTLQGRLPLAPKQQDLTIEIVLSASAKEPDRAGADEVDISVTISYCEEPILFELETVHHCDTDQLRSHLRQSKGDLLQSLADALQASAPQEVKQRENMRG